MTPTPPRWAEALLRMFVRPADFDSVSGDLLEEYRETVHSDVWYVRQVLGYIERSAQIWALLFAAAYIARTALDWLAPPVDFHFRSTVSTFVGIGLLLATGLSASKHSGSFLAGALAGVATTTIGAVISIVGAAGLLAVWHDPGTMAAVRASGGLGEVFTLPLMMILPGAVFGAIGGIAGAAIARLKASAAA